jgi:integrase
VQGACVGHTPYRSNFRRVFVKAVKEAGLEGRGINVRQLRHTAASLMLSNGLDVLDVQDRLGHSRGSVTLDIYGRVLVGRRNTSTELLNSVMSTSDLSFATSKDSVS